MLGYKKISKKGISWNKITNTFKIYKKVSIKNNLKILISNKKVSLVNFIKTKFQRKMQKTSSSIHKKEN